MFETAAPIEPGQRAPDFELPSVEHPGKTVSLAEYRGKSAVLIAFERGLWCSFCRRHIAQLSVTRQKLQPLGIEALAIVATNPERARLYCRYRPTSVPLAADPDYETHRAYGLRKRPQTPELQQSLDSMRFGLHEVARNPTDLSELTGAIQSVKNDQTIQPQDPQQLWDVVDALRRLYPIEMTQDDQRDKDDAITMSIGQFLVDPDGIVRWAKIEGVDDPPAGLGNFPNDEKLLAIARTFRAEP